jgi:predicted nucleotidyltransferase component of viral defense system
MISLAYIREWRQNAPWLRNDQVEQDLIICRALVEIFTHPGLKDHLAFRGGTALFKLHLPPLRYSEDIDLVQVHAGPIGPVMSALQEKLNPWLGIPKRKQGEGRVTLTYRMTSEEGAPLKLKVEINSREHFTVLGFEKREMAIESRWFSGRAAILTYQLDELLGTKVRALYQRRKGRDLFDLWTAFATGKPQPERMIGCFLHYLEKEGHRVSRAEFERNLLAKFDDPRFIADITPLVVSQSSFDLPRAAELVFNRLAPLIPGDPWQGKSST